ncbi:nucleotidyltransferase domain-containing protein [Thiomicrospira microaerophila]|uniref:nucleotidyltransferase domain-containing protein n=1 Tax=Thiomicrospira microaerophila TaxID=406020 RepID=UPI00200D655B|nr:nucleotidyltransferase domain-containing protein [Thiomicrospira microaerophila]UQB43252.1 nucleotidyltransferase domain-containing protein [Thiomicrospira microaerophila]
MRLTPHYQTVIKNTFLDVFKQGEIYLFGSRVDDTKKGGDIDLFIHVEDSADLFEKKITFLAKLKRQLGDQKIDIVFAKDENRLIEQEIKKCRIAL